MSSFVDSSSSSFACAAAGSTGPRMVDLRDRDGLRALEAKVYTHFFRKWPTRYRAICPPAFAVTAAHRSLMLPNVAADDDRDALVLRVPEDFSDKLAFIAQATPSVLVHPNADFVTQQAYISWMSQAPAPQLRPATLWVSASALFDALTWAYDSGWSSLPVVIMAGNAVCHFEMPISARLLDSVTAALSAARLTPLQPEQKVLQKAPSVVENYGKTPWLFLRYEVKNCEQWIAVNYAPTCRLANGVLSDC